MEAATVVLLSQTDHHLFEVAHPRLDVFDSPRCTRLATQAWMGRRLVALAAASIEPRLRDPEIAAVHSGSHEAQRPLGSDVARGAIPIRLCEDAYPGWISAADVAEGAIRRLSIGSESARREAGSAGDGGTERRNGGGGGCEGGGSAGKGGMEGVREAVAAFAEAARAESNRYLWGGTTGPHFDCSGLVQRAYACAGVWVPRDAFQQEAFCEPLCVDCIARGDLVFFGTTRATHVGIVTCAKLCHPHHHTPPLPAGSSPSHTRDSSPCHACDSSPSGAWHTVQVAFLHSSGRDDGHDGIVSDCLRLLLPCPPRRTRLTCSEAPVLMEHADGSGDACGCCGGVDNEGEGGSGEERRVGAEQEWVSAEGGSRACGAGEAGEAGEWKVVKRWHVASRKVGSREVGSREVGSREVGSREVGRKGDSAQAPVEGEKGHRQEGGMAVVARHTAGREETVLAEGGMGAAEVGEAVEVQAQGRVAAHYGAQLRGFGRVLHALPPSLAHIPPHLVLPLQL